MHKTVAETEAFLSELLPALDGTPESDSDVIICPPYTALAAAVERCDGTRARVAAQNMHEADSGAFTGEIAAPMLVELGVSGVVLGHSERRQYFNETDEALARKVPAALAAGLQPILCIGEQEAERDSGETGVVLAAQIEADLAEVPHDRLADVVIAYEPVWAIGTGRTASPGQAEEAIALIRERIRARDRDAAEAVRILYGGSVKPDNAAELLAQSDLDGALVGGASLDPGDFLALVQAATP
jgi:triosephosphate isomerase